MWGLRCPTACKPGGSAQLKKMGCNAWRTAHNPPSVALLDACDRLGMLVMDENRHLGDCYSHHSPTGTTATNLSDLATMIQRDRNHPSIIMWSMCNEEGLQGTPEGARIFSAMMKVVHRYDHTRPITCAMNRQLAQATASPTWRTSSGSITTHGNYDAIHQRHPDQPMFGSEDTNDKTTRGEYVDDRTNGMGSCYNLTEKAWLPVVTRPFMAGSFTWTGFDYKGEPNPYGWPDVSNNTGLMDVCGFPKDKYYYFESCWSDKPMVHLMPDGWNWPGKEGQNIRVIAFSNARQVELFLNGKSLGVQNHAAGRPRGMAGSLSARPIGWPKPTTTARWWPPTRWKPRARPPASSFHLTGQRSRPTGKTRWWFRSPFWMPRAGWFPTPATASSFHLTGGGRILGVGNGNPSDHDPDKADQRNAFHGHCMAIIQAGSHPGVLQLTATSPGLTSASTDFQTR